MQCYDAAPRDRRAGDGVADGDAGVGVGAGIDHQPIGPIHRLVDGVDQHPLVIGLHDAQFGLVFFGHDVQQEEGAVKRLINRVSVDAAFFKKLSPIENLMYAARLYGVNGREAREKIVEILTRLGIEERSIGEPLEEMSRGMQQKVAIVRALVAQPELLLLDEPTTGLDPVSKKHVADFILRVRDESQTAIVLTSKGVPPASRTPALTASAMVCKWICPGTTSLKLLIIPIKGCSISLSEHPKARNRDR